MLEKNIFLGRITVRGLAVAVIAAFTVAVSPNISVAMDPVDWNSAAPNLPTNSFSAMYGGSDQRIDILDIGDFGSTDDGTFIRANPNPTAPSTGTGVFTPFKRLQRGSGSCNGNNDCQNINGQKVASQNGFNSDQGEPGVNYDTKAGTWTRSVTMSEFNITGPGGFIELQLDANSSGSATSDGYKLVITDLQIFIESGSKFKNPEAESNPNGDENSGYTGTPFDPSNNSLLGKTPIWQLDSAANGNVDILLQASICDTPGQCGSGKGDLSVFIPVALLGSFSGTDQFVFYSEYLYVNSGFEEWRFGDTVVADVAEPGMLTIFGVGILGMGAMRRRRRSQKILG
ncbi:MAG: hypothetical protein O3C34_15750 [Proteobacteria bacterium]|nr:hypothetical protein [Pseudomonadota bacterium]